MGGTTRTPPTVVAEAAPGSHPRAPCATIQGMTIGFAHRGARLDEPENTIPAFRRALEQGATGLESDAWVAADGEVVLVHDESVRAGLRRVHVHRATSERLRGLGVPRLQELYETLGTECELSIDVKEHGAARPVIEVAGAARADERLWLCSGSLELLTELRDVAGGAHLVHSVRKKRIAGSIERHAADLRSRGIDAMNMHHTDWTKGLVSLFHRFDVAAFAWDVQETRYLRAAVQMGVDALYSDHVDRLMAAVGEWSA
jgi:glycerophosphoryl diester phosphodiesterase